MKRADIHRFMAALALLPAIALAQPTEDDGFKPIFDGKTLNGWDANPKLWKIDDGAIHGSTHPDGLKGGNTFCIWRGGEPDNFELKFKFKLENGNSGVQYRSKDLGNWRVGGYQFEIRNEKKWPGYLYHERGGKGRGRVSMVGQFTVIDEQGKKNQTQLIDEDKASKQAGFKPGEWNEAHIIARGNHVIHKINGFTVTEMVDYKKDQRCMKGIIALQIHQGGPMKVWFKDIQLKQYKQTFGEAKLLFNGTDTDGWKIFPDEAVAQNTWSVKDGMLHNAGKPNGYIRTKQKYANYVIRVQFQHVTKGNSGLLLRLVGEDKVWPRSIEAQGMKNNMGDIWNIGNFPMKVDDERRMSTRHERHTPKIHPSNEKPIGEWNQYEVLLDGGTLRIYVNDLLQNWGEECWVTPGHIALQSEGARLNYRNVLIIPILDK